MLFESNSFDNYGMDLTYLNIPLKHVTKENQNNLYNKTEGFEKGNMFKNEYSPYKNYTIKRFIPKNRKEELELTIFELDFALNDLNLYLDLHPEDTQLFNIFTKYNHEARLLKEEYAKNYAPLCLSDVSKAQYNWSNDPWSWEKGGNLDV